MSKILNSVLSGNTALTSQDIGLRRANSSDYKVTHEPQTPAEQIQEQKSLWRLKSALSGDKPLKENVHRGYYLNITV